MYPRVLSITLAAIVLSGCGGAVVQRTRDSQPALPPYTGPICLLPKPLPDNVDSTPLGRAIANSATYGGFAKMNLKLANVARSVGADAVVNKRSKMKIAPIPWGAARPQSWGMAVRIKNPEAFDCVASGGRLYDQNGPILAPPSPSPQVKPQASPQGQVRAEKQQPGSEYDACMVRVMKITDAQLRASMMTTCDDLD
ncbi:hypothetical protein [Pseudomonas sp. RIT-PI-AD]|uniref:hypothetical protein n=1 Tax=Pseudomonas sp. RIT-PI-AD TaxID=3035294 RepID=UPI0021DA20D2|nr:hypothetical protein [Pseudomonas sp. RIT-PI-AD]